METHFSIGTKMRTVAVVNGTFIYVAETFWFVLPLAAIVGAVADAIH